MPTDTTSKYTNTMDGESKAKPADRYGINITYRNVAVDEAELVNGNDALKQATHGTLRLEEGESGGAPAIESAPPLQLMPKRPMWLKVRDHNLRMGERRVGDDFPGRHKVRAPLHLRELDGVLVSEEHLRANRARPGLQYFHCNLMQTRGTPGALRVHGVDAAPHRSEGTHSDGCRIGHEVPLGEESTL